MVTISLTPLLAGIDDWLQILVPVVFVIIWIVGQIMSAVGQKPAQPRRQPGQPARPAGGLAEEIESFLKKVQQGRAVGQPPQQPAARPPQRVQSTPPQSRRELAKPPRPDVVEAELVVPRSRPVSEHGFGKKKERLGRSGNADRKSSSSTNIDLADEKMAEHVHQVFEHNLGMLTDTSTSNEVHEKHDQAESKSKSAAGDVPTPLQTVRKMLAEPDSVRNAVILSEILGRPRQRW